MEGLLRRSFLALSLFLVVSSLATVSSQAQSSGRAGVIERSKSQLLLASLQPSIDSSVPGSLLSSQLFLTSPSGNSFAYLIRHDTSLTSQGAGQGFCYIQVQENGNSIWDSTCTPVTEGNACALAFSDAGLQIFDGSRSSWRTNTNHGHLRYLMLTDAGNLEILDQRGMIMWAASQEQRANQNCGNYSAASPFATPSYNAEPSLGQGIIEDSGFTQPQSTYPSGLGQNLNYPQQGTSIPAGFSGSSNQPFSSFNQPIGGNSLDNLGDDGVSAFNNRAPGKGSVMTRVVSLVLACLLSEMMFHQFL
ncbi:hypothetical protein MLD38_034370 [Melastoma candidum]|uniref:Uncharacterized protein n=1 Tax=Melastoma candidum TaxID=119954 RepID=A0ACB9M9H9_9MYRT|nr:hypothetical protein MLD38_034370 [Melastoma candidum]